MEPDHLSVVHNPQEKPPRMQLLDLPNEILADIFDHVGPAYFREDPGRLAVSKHWRLHAQPVVSSHPFIKLSSLLRTECRISNSRAHIKSFGLCIDMVGLPLSRSFWEFLWFLRECPKLTHLHVTFPGDYPFDQGYDKMTTSILKYLLRLPTITSVALDVRFWSLYLDDHRKQIRNTDRGQPRADPQPPLKEFFVMLDRDHWFRNLLEASFKGGLKSTKYGRFKDAKTARMLVPATRNNGKKALFAYDLLTGERRRLAWDDNDGEPLPSRSSLGDWRRGLG